MDKVKKVIIRDYHHKLFPNISNEQLNRTMDFVEKIFDAADSTTDPVEFKRKEAKINKEFGLSVNR